MSEDEPSGLICRACEQPAAKVGHVWGRERVEFRYFHDGGEVHTVTVTLYEASLFETEDYYRTHHRAL